MNNTRLKTGRKSFLLLGALTLSAIAYAAPAKADGSHRQSAQSEYHNEWRGDQRRTKNRRNDGYRSGGPRYDNRGSDSYYDYRAPAPGYYGRDDYGDEYGYDYDPSYGDPYYGDAPNYDDDYYYGSNGGYYGDDYRNRNNGGILGEILGGVLGGGVSRGGVPNDIIGAVLGGVLTR